MLWLDSGIMVVASKHRQFVSQVNGNTCIGSHRMVSGHCHSNTVLYMPTTIWRVCYDEKSHDYSYVCIVYPNVGNSCINYSWLSVDIRKQTQWRIAVWISVRIEILVWYKYGRWKRDRSVVKPGWWGEIGGGQGGEGYSFFLQI